MASARLRSCHGGADGDDDQINIPDPT